MGSRTIKKEVLAILAESDRSGAEPCRELEAFPVKDVVNALFSGICRAEERLRWQAVTCMGIFVARLAEQDMEEARIIMRRLLWSLNDESGGIGWGALESLAEIMVRHDGLAREYVHMLVSYMQPDGDEPFQDGNQLEHETLQRGLMWGIGLLARENRRLLQGRNVPSLLLPYLASPDPVVRGLAAWSLGHLRAAGAAAALEPLTGDVAAVRYYDNGELQTETVATLAGQAIERIKAAEDGA